jgi:hypothetical protein
MEDPGFVSPIVSDVLEADPEYDMEELLFSTDKGQEMEASSEEDPIIG